MLLSDHARGKIFLINTNILILWIAYMIDKTTKPGGIIKLSKN